FLSGEERRPTLVGQHGEKCLLVGNLAPKRIRNAGGAAFVGRHERPAVVFSGDDVVDEDAAIDEIHGAPAGPEGAALERELARIAEDGRAAEGRKTVAQALGPPPTRHPAPRTAR